MGFDERTITEEELGTLTEDLWRRAQNELHSTAGLGPRHRDALVVELMAGCGLRAAEVAALAREDILLSLKRPSEKVARCYVRVRGGKKRDAHQVETVPLPSRLAAELRDWLLMTPGAKSSPAPLFTTRSGKPLTRQRVWVQVRRAVLRLGLRPAISPHSFRHLFITRLASQPGADPHTVASLARLKGLGTIMVYFHSDVEKRADLVERAAGKRRP